MKLEFLGAAHEVTGSCTLLYACDKKIIIDCGMEQGPDTYENCEIPISPSDIDCVLLTHAHIDHSGKIPMLTANGFSGPIYATTATTKLCNIMLMDSAHIQEFEAAWRNRKAKRAGKDEYIPPYTTEDVQKTLPLFKSCNYENEYEIAEGIKIRFIDAGHLLGSSSIEITVSENGKTETLLFSGDIGNVDRPLINNPTFPTKADFVVIESTYGNRLHGERKDYVLQLSQIIQETLDRGGNVVIPSFAVGRTQELLYLIHQIKDRNLIKGHADFPVYVDSPLAVEATSIYANKEELRDFYDPETLDYIKKGINILNFKGLKFATTSDDSMQINMDKAPKVIISASGMCEAGRIRHHLKHNLWRKDSTILFVGYQAEGTLGRSVINGAQVVKLFGEPIQVNAHIAKMDGISGHADEKILMNWLKNIQNKPKMVFVNHGADLVCEEFAQTISEELKVDATAPFNGAIYDLSTGECIEKGNTVHIDKKEMKTKIASASFEKLILANKRLASVIEKNKGGANKDLAKLTSQINELCNKWDR